MSNTQKCMDIAAAHPEASRAELIELFVDAGISRATANTYSSTVKKELLDTAEERARKAARDNETDEEIEDRLTERFDVINMLAHASCLGQIRSLIISGPAGLGKSYSVEQALAKYDPTGLKTVIAKGYVRPTGLYRLFHKYQHPGNVVVLDDADSIFNDIDALNILKAACDTTKERKLSWYAETRMVDEEGEPIDREFVFNGTVIFITNKDFDGEISRGKAGAEHLEALVSRSHYVDCDMHSQRDYLVRIKQVAVKLGMLRIQRKMDQVGEDTVVNFIEENADNLRELTLRMALKLADVYQLNPTKFESLARVSCFKH